MFEYIRYQNMIPPDMKNNPIIPSLYKYILNIYIQNTLSFGRQEKKSVSLPVATHVEFSSSRNPSLH